MPIRASIVKHYAAAAENPNLFKMAEQSRHRSLDTLREYVRGAELFRDHAGAGLL